MIIICIIIIIVAIIIIIVIIITIIILTLTYLYVNSQKTKHVAEDKTGPYLTLLCLNGQGAEGLSGALSLVKHGEPAM